MDYMSDFFKIIFNICKKSAAIESHIQQNREEQNRTKRELIGLIFVTLQPDYCENHKEKCRYPIPNNR